MLIRVDHKLRIARSALPSDAEKLITEALSIPNAARQKMMEHNIPGWQKLPAKVELWELDFRKDDLLMPRGFGFNLIPGLQNLNIDFEIEDRRTFSGLPNRGQPISLHSWQNDAIPSILSAQEGIWKAPAGSGKTVAALEVIRRLSTRSIVIVNTKDILWQWLNRAANFLGSDYPVGQVGDSIFAPSKYLTIATAQTLHSRFDELESTSFFDSFGLMCLDECHHATAETYNRLVNRFSARYRIGMSATPDKTGDFALATNVLGPIIHETSPKSVKTLMAPTVYKIPTKFSFPYRGARGNIPSNYAQLIQKLVEDEDRNKLITRMILLEEGSHSLVVSKRLEHIEKLIEMIEDDYDCPILKLTGSEGSEERRRVVEVAATEPSVIFSTLADEALDIPRLDRLFLVFPQRNSGLITQQVGRVERIFSGKKDAKVYDFCDLSVGPLENQWKVRRREVYDPRGYKIMLWTDEDGYQSL